MPILTLQATCATLGSVEHLITSERTQSLRSACSTSLLSSKQPLIVLHGAVGGSLFRED